MPMSKSFEKLIDEIQTSALPQDKGISGGV
jgi:hypothetical protein